MRKKVEGLPGFANGWIPPLRCFVVILTPLAGQKGLDGQNQQR